MDFLITLRAEFPKHVHQERYQNHEIISIRFDEIVSRYRRRVDVMLPERSEKILRNKSQRLIEFVKRLKLHLIVSESYLSYDRYICRAPRIRYPMHHSRQEVCC